MKNRHVNIPIFIPHLGCPNDCVFCNQRIISGVSEFDPKSVIPIIEEALSTIESNASAEIAFFGGSFTGIDKKLMEDLLCIANGYLKQGRVSSIRCSTRPDYINDEIIEVLLRYGVATVELGIQSISDGVLSASSRGHSSKDTLIACKKIKAAGLRLGGQMMIGLPNASSIDEENTAEFIVSMGADEARIYPTIVFKGTKLACMTEAGYYSPLSLEEALKRSADVFKIFVGAGVKVLRIGLCDSENLHNDDTYSAGSNHPAIGELVEGEYYYNIIDSELKKNQIVKVSKITVFVSKGHTSRVIGQNKKNKIRFIKKYELSSFKVFEISGIPEYQVRLEIE